MSEYKQGDGARTLEWVPGMLADQDGPGCEPGWYPGGWRVSRNPRGFLRVGPLANAAPEHNPQATPDLTDRATFLLALDELRRRGVFHPGDRADLWILASSTDSDIVWRVDRMLYESRPPTDAETDAATHAWREPR